MSWKPIEIKPNDQSLLGKSFLPNNYDDREVIMIFVGQDIIVTKDKKENFEVAWRLRNSMAQSLSGDINALNWQIWEEPKRWRAYDIREMSFWYVASNLDVFCDQDSGDDWDEKFECGNYFRTKQQAQTYAEECKKLAMKLHESWGE